MAFLSEEDKENIRLNPWYDDLPIGESIILFKVGDEWQKTDTYDALYAKFYVKVTKNLLGPCFSKVGEAGLMNIHTQPHVKKPIEKVDFQVGAVHAGTEASSMRNGSIVTYFGAEAKATLAGGRASIFDLHLGAGVSTGAGIKDDSVKVKVAGCGVKVGRKVAISVFDNEFGVDFGRLFS